MEAKEHRTTELSTNPYQPMAPMDDEKTPLATAVSPTAGDGMEAKCTDATATSFQMMQRQ